MKLLVVNADDFGFTRDVNAGIVEAHTRGILTATTLMANGDAFEDAINLAKQHPTLDVGCHLVLCGGTSLLDGRALPETVAQLMRVLLAGRIDVYHELRAQVIRIRDAGIAPLHLDTHKHTHLLPPVLNAVARLSEEFQIPWVRRPFDFPPQPGTIPLSKRLVSRAFGAVRSRFHRVLSSHGCRTTDHFAGFQITGRYNAADVATLVRNLPEGSTEFMVHPGILGKELQAARTRLKQSRADELAALTSPAARTALEDAGVRLVRYGEPLISIEPRP